MTTAQAAAAVGLTTATFRMWASRHRLRPIRRVQVGRSLMAVWDLDEVLERRVLDPAERG